MLRRRSYCKCSHVKVVELIRKLQLLGEIYVDFELNVGVVRNPFDDTPVN